MNFKATNELENYVKNYLKIPYVNFEGMDPEVCQVIVETIAEALKEYPILNNVICAIGQTDDTTAHINTLVNGPEKDPNSLRWVEYYFDQKYEVQRDFSELMSCGRLTLSGKQIDFLCLTLKNVIVSSSLAELDSVALAASNRGFHPKHCQTAKSYVWHEIGHILDYLLNISKNPKYLNLLIDKEAIGSLSRYATVSSEEAFAEVFAEYHSTDNPSSFVKELMESILKDYGLKIQRSRRQIAAKFR